MNGGGGRRVAAAAAGKENVVNVGQWVVTVAVADRLAIVDSLANTAAVDRM